ncbi:MAG: hypothetical protein RLZZ324_1015 [Candidatus Parcubacteria bacterium]|jgi:predicted RNA-binding protein with PUA-like domain
MHMRRYWLCKSEPEAYSWDRLVREKKGRWDGVRNHAAALHLRAMRVGDLCVFYHSTTGKEAVGIMRVTRTAYPDPTSFVVDASGARQPAPGQPKGDWVAVDVVPVHALARPVPLAEIKSDAVLKKMEMVRQGRLSVSPVSAGEWKRLLALSGTRA